jgi:GNAT superfamily N-acetyltransferase
MNISYRKATPSDIDLIVKYRVEFLEEFWGPQEQNSKDDFKKHFKNYLVKGYSENSFIFYLAYNGTTHAGIGGVIFREQPGNFKNPTGRVGYVLNMYTPPQFRRKGIGETILNKLVADTKELGIILMELHATKDGVPLYERNGFKIHPEPTYRRYLTI